MGLREDLFSKCKARTAPLAVPTPEWPDFDGKIFVRKLTAGELDAYWNEDEEGNERARFVALVACDSEGKTHFLSADAQDISELPFEVVDRIAMSGQRFNSMLPEQREKIAKN